MEQVEKAPQEEAPKIMVDTANLLMRLGREKDNLSFEVKEGLKRMLAEALKDLSE